MSRKRKKGYVPLMFLEIDFFLKYGIISDIFVNTKGNLMKYYQQSLIIERKL